MRFWPKLIFLLVLIALLAFALGVCVTVLCFRLRVFHEESEEDSDDRTL